MSFDYRYIFFSNILLTFWQSSVRKHNQNNTHPTCFVQKI